MSIKVTIIYGSVRHHRKGIRAAKFITGKCSQRGYDTSLVDPKNYNLPLLDKMYKEYKKSKAPEPMTELAELFKSSDAFIIVSAEYNHSIPPALSNLLDHFLEEYYFKPSGILCYSRGSFGGVRAAMQLRAMLAEMGMSSIPSILSVPNIAQSFDEDGNPDDETYHERAKRFLDELQWYAEALKEKRNNKTPY